MTATSVHRGFAMMRVVGMLLITAGLLLTTGVGWRYMQGARTRAEARESWTRLMHEPPAEASPELQTLPGQPVARVIFPRLGIDEVVLEGVTATELNAAPGHHPRTPLPGRSGNSVISAHRDRHFFPLGRAEVGDTIVTETRDDGRLRWRIVGRRITVADSAFVLPTDTPMLTLTTCWPIRHLGPAPDRLILTAEPIDLGDEMQESFVMEGDGDASQNDQSDGAPDAGMPASVSPGTDARPARPPAPVGAPGT